MTDESREQFADFNRFHADSNVIQHPWYDIKLYQTSRLQFKIRVKFPQSIRLVVDLPNSFPGTQTSCIFQYRRWCVSKILVVRITSAYWWSPTKSYGGDVSMNECWLGQKFDKLILAKFNEVFSVFGRHKACALRELLFSTPSAQCGPCVSPYDRWMAKMPSSMLNLTLPFLDYDSLLRIGHRSKQTKRLQ